MKKILIAYASAGAGHKKAAEAVYKALLEKNNDNAKVTCIDTLDYSNLFFKFSYRGVYIFLISRFPKLWGFFYNLLNNRIFFTLNSPFRRFFNFLNTKKLLKFVDKEKFDLIISTHFMATEVIGRHKQKGKTSAKLVNIITDFKPHLFWVSKYVDSYIVASDVTYSELLKIDVDLSKVKVMGIPIDKKFGLKEPKSNVRQRLGLSADKFTVLVMGGGYGIGPIAKTVESLQASEADFQMIVVCGHNKKLCDKLEEDKRRSQKPCLIVGYSDDVDEMLSASDIMLSKAGGLAVSEALAKGVPIVALNPIPGQEKRNADFIVENGLGFVVSNFEQLKTCVEKLIIDKDRLLEIKRKSIMISSPDSAATIAEYVLEELKM
ncbi:MAG: glycosyltransferase [Candidatus Omnitrophota bacterium]